MGIISRFIQKSVQKIKSIETNLLVALSAMMISLCALAVSIQEVRIMRSQQRLTMLPYLSLSLSYNDKGYGVYLKNNGAGIARIEDFSISFEDKVYRDWLIAARALQPNDTTIGYNIIKTNSILGEMIQPAESVTLFAVPWTDSTRKLEKKVRDLKLRLCYASLLDEYWLLENTDRTQVEEPCGQ